MSPASSQTANAAAALQKSGDDEATRRQVQGDLRRQERLGGRHDRHLYAPDRGRAGNVARACGSPHSPRRGLQHKEGLRPRHRRLHVRRSSSIRATRTSFKNRGRRLAPQGRLDRAIADYTEAIRLDPKYARAYNNRGNVYNDRRATTIAPSPNFNAAIRLDPQDWRRPTQPRRRLPRQGRPRTRHRRPHGRRSSSSQTRGRSKQSWQRPCCQGRPRPRHRRLQ